MLSNDGEGLKAPLEYPACQVTACFERATVYVVIKESDTNALSVDSGEKQMILERDSFADVNAFKLILYLCTRHDYDLRYLLGENELEITKRHHLVLNKTD